METFYKTEDDESVLRSIGDGFFVVKLSGVPRIDQDKNEWKDGGYLSVLCLRQTDLDLIWYKISVNENKLKTDDGDLSDDVADLLSGLKITPIFIKTKRTQWIFDLYQLEYDLAILLSEDVEFSDLKEKIGEESANMVFKIKNEPELKKLVGFN